MLKKSIFLSILLVQSIFVHAGAMRSNDLLTDLEFLKNMLHQVDTTLEQNILQEHIRTFEKQAKAQGITLTEYLATFHKQPTAQAAPESTALKLLQQLEERARQAGKPISEYLQQLEQKMPTLPTPEISSSGAPPPPPPPMAPPPPPGIPAPSTSSTGMAKPTKLLVEARNLTAEQQKASDEELLDILEELAGPTAVTNAPGYLKNFVKDFTRKLESKESKFQPKIDIDQLKKGLDIFITQFIKNSDSNTFLQDLFENIQQGIYQQEFLSIIMPFLFNPEPSLLKAIGGSFENILINAGSAARREIEKSSFAQEFTSDTAFLQSIGTQQTSRENIIQSLNRLRINPQYLPFKTLQEDIIQSIKRTKTEALTSKQGLLEELKQKSVATESSTSPRVTIIRYLMTGRENMEVDLNRYLFVPQRFTNEYKETLQKVIQQKQKGREKSHRGIPLEQYIHYFTTHASTLEEFIQELKKIPSTAEKIARRMGKTSVQIIIDANLVSKIHKAIGISSLPNALQRLYQQLPEFFSAEEQDHLRKLETLYREEQALIHTIVELLNDPYLQGSAALYKRLQVIPVPPQLNEEIKKPLLHILAGLERTPYVLRRFLIEKIRSEKMGRLFLQDIGRNLQRIIEPFGSLTLLVQATLMVPYKEIYQSMLTGNQGPDHHTFTTLLNIINFPKRLSLLQKSLSSLIQPNHMASHQDIMSPLDNELKSLNVELLNFIESNKKESNKETLTHLSTLIEKSPSLLNTGVQAGEDYTQAPYKEKVEKMLSALNVYSLSEFIAHFSSFYQIGIVELEKAYQTFKEEIIAPLRQSFLIFIQRQLIALNSPQNINTIPALWVDFQKNRREAELYAAIYKIIQNEFGEAISLLSSLIQASSNLQSSGEKIITSLGSARITLQQKIERDESIAGLVADNQQKKFLINTIHSLIQKIETDIRSAISI